MRRLVVRGVVRGVVWDGGGGGRRCCVWDLVMGFPLMAAGGRPRGGVCPRWLGVAGALGVFARCISGLVPGGGGAEGMVWGWHCWWREGRGWVLCWTGVWASRRVVWVLGVRVVRFLRSLAGRGVEVGCGWLGIRGGSGP